MPKILTSALLQCSNLTQHRSRIFNLRLKLISLLLLASFSVSAMAEWNKVVSGKSDTVYADPASIRKKDGKATMWHLLDYNSAQNLGGIGPYLSMKRRTEFDCSKSQYRFLYTLYFSKNMATGDVIGKESKSDKWIPLPLITSAINLRKIACGKK